MRCDNRITERIDCDFDVFDFAIPVFSVFIDVAVFVQNF